MSDQHDHFHLNCPFELNSDDAKRMPIILSHHRRRSCFSDRYNLYGYYLVAVTSAAIDTDHFALPMI